MSRLAVADERPSALVDIEWDLSTFKYTTGSFFPSWWAYKGGDGAAGKRGDDGRGSGPPQCDATNGEHGGDGRRGKHFDFRRPRVYLIVKDIDTQVVDFEKVFFYFPWLRGGPGGSGGKGGDGGHGARGRDHAYPKKGPKRGGDGGNAGAGGHEGFGGNGWAGAEIVLMGPRTALDRLSWAKFENTGGEPGPIGSPGWSGTPGGGADGGWGEPWYPNPRDGYPGKRPEPPVRKPPANWKPPTNGPDGSVSLVEFEDFDSLFPKGRLKKVAKKKVAKPRRRSTK